MNARLAHERKNTRQPSNTLVEHVVREVLSSIAKPQESLRIRLLELCSRVDDQEIDVGKEPNDALLAGLAQQHGVGTIAMNLLDNPRAKEALKDMLGMDEHEQYKGAPRIQAQVALIRVHQAIAGELAHFPGLKIAEMGNDMRVSLAKILALKGDPNVAHEIVSVRQFTPTQIKTLQCCAESDARVFNESKNPLTQHELIIALTILRTSQEVRANARKTLASRDTNAALQPILLLHQSAEESPEARAAAKILRRWKNSEFNKTMIKITKFLPMFFSLCLRVLLRSLLLNYSLRVPIRQYRSEFQGHIDWQAEQFTLPSGFSGNRLEISMELRRQVERAKREGRTWDIIHPQAADFLPFQDLLEQIADKADHWQLQELIDLLLPMMQRDIELHPVSDHETETLAILRTAQEMIRRLGRQA